MERRYRLLHKKNGFICEAPFTTEGIKKLKAIRRMLPNLFRKGRIFEIVQALPSEVVLHKVYKVGQKHGWKPEYCLEQFVKAENEEQKYEAAL